MSDLARTVAAVFRRRGAPDMTASEFKLAVSMDLRWLAPADARRLLMRAVDLGVMTADGDRVRPAFDVTRVNVPVTFRPTLAVLEDAVNVASLPPLPPTPAFTAPTQPIPIAPGVTTGPRSAEAPPGPNPPTPRVDAPPTAGPPPAPPTVPATAGATLVTRALAAAARASGQDAADVNRAFEEEKARRGGLFSNDVVALIIARRLGVDAAAWAREAAEASSARAD